MLPWWLISFDFTRLLNQGSWLALAALSPTKPNVVPLRLQNSPTDAYFGVLVYTVAILCIGSASTKLVVTPLFT